MMRPTPNRIESTVARAIQSGVVQPDTRALLFHDLDVLRARLGALAEAFPANALHAIAIKANPVVAILREVVAAGFGLEAASIEEVHLAVAAGCPPDRIVYDSPAKTTQELAEALALGVRINSDSVAELERIDELIETTASDSLLGLRVNPRVGSGAIAATSVAGARSRFGVDIRQAADVFARFDWLSAVHVHVGSQGCSLEQLLQAAERVVELRAAVGDSRLRHVDLGGGLPVAYDSEANPPSFAEYATRLRKRVPSLFDADVELITEFGRAIQANSGWALSCVEYVKHQGEQRIIVGHLGADFLLRPVYNPEDWSHEFLLLDASARRKDAPNYAQSLAGPLCFGGDIIGREVHLPEAARGDWLVIRDTGAYTLAMWSRHCSRGIPAVYGVEGGEGGIELRQMRAAEQPEDVVSFWS